MKEKQKLGYPSEAIELLEKYFPKGDKRRGEAMVILAEAWNQGLHHSH